MYQTSLLLHVSDVYISIQIIVCGRFLLSVRVSRMDESALFLLSASVCFLGIFFFFLHDQYSALQLLLWPNSQSGAAAHEAFCDDPKWVVLPKIICR